MALIGAAAGAISSRRRQDSPDPNRGRTSRASANRAADRPAPLASPAAASSSPLQRARHSRLRVRYGSLPPPQLLASLPRGTLADLCLSHGDEERIVRDLDRGDLLARLVIAHQLAGMHEDERVPSPGQPPHVSVTSPAAAGAAVAAAAGAGGGIPAAQLVHPSDSTFGSPAQLGGPPQSFPAKRLGAGREQASTTSRESQGNQPEGQKEDNAKTGSEDAAEQVNTGAPLPTPPVQPTQTAPAPGQQPQGGLALPDSGPARRDSGGSGGAPSGNPLQPQNASHPSAGNLGSGWGTARRRTLPMFDKPLAAAKSHSSEIASPGVASSSDAACTEHTDATGERLSEMRMVPAARQTQNKGSPPRPDKPKGEELEIPSDVPPLQQKLIRYFSEWRDKEESDQMTQSLDQMTAGDLRRMEQLFHEMDVDKSGTLDFSELQNLWAKVFPKMVRFELDLVTGFLFDDIDDDDSGSISWPELKSYITGQYDSVETAEINAVVGLTGFVRRRWPDSYRHWVWSVMEQPASEQYMMPRLQSWALQISMVSQAVIFAAVVNLMLESVPKPGDTLASVTDVLEKGCALFFSCEFIIRCACCPCTPSDDNRTLLSQRQFWTRLFTWIDLVSVLPSFLQWFTSAGSGGNYSFLRIVRMVRLVRVLRVMKLGRYSQGIQLLMCAMSRARLAFVWMFMLFAMAIILFAACVFHAEQQESEFDENRGQWIRMQESDLDDAGQAIQFQTLFVSMWWAIGTLTGCSYGDIIPKTVAGKFISSMTMIAGLLCCAYPITIITVTFSDVWDQYKHGLERKKRRKRLVQTLELHKKKMDAKNKEEGKRRRGKGSASLDVIEALQERVEKRKSETQKESRQRKGGDSHSTWFNGKAGGGSGNSPMLDREVKLFCTHCHNQVMKDAVFCQRCGTRRPPWDVCPCGNVYLDDTNFCRKCGVQRAIDPDAALRAMRREQAAEHWETVRQQALVHSPHPQSGSAYGDMSTGFPQSGLSSAAGGFEQMIRIGAPSGSPAVQQAGGYDHRDSVECLLPRAADIPVTDALPPRRESPTAEAIYAAPPAAEYAQKKPAVRPLQQPPPGQDQNASPIQPGEVPAAGRGVPQNTIPPPAASGAAQPPAGGKPVAGP